MTRDKDDDLLEGLFAEARARPAIPSDTLMARVLADAQATQPRRGLARWRDLLATLGGAPGLGGLVMATCVGFWLGVAPPQGLPDIGGRVFGTEIVSDEDGYAPGLTGFGWDLEEG